MNKPAVIGVTGKKRSGKDEVYKALAGNLARVTRIAFADPLKIELAKACGIPLSLVEEKKELFRLGLQWWGTEFRRGLFGDNYWIDRAEEEFHKVVDHEKPSVVVFTDVRFPNEGALIHKLGGKVWRVMRPLPGEGLARPQEAHASETAMDSYPVDRVLNNDQDLFQLQMEVMCGFLADFGAEALCIQK